MSKPAVKVRLSGFCNPTLPRTEAYDPHQRCRGCDCAAPACPCNPEETPVTAPLTDAEKAVLYSPLQGLAASLCGPEPVYAAVERIIAARVAQARAAALREAADRMPAFHDRDEPEWAITSACEWLRKRAGEAVTA